MNKQILYSKEEVMIRDGWDDSGTMITYYLNGCPIIYILDNTYHDISSYAAMIASYGNSDRNSHESINSSDIDIAKLKALLKAKELGWPIKELV